MGCGKEWKEEEVREVGYDGRGEDMVKRALLVGIRIGKN